MRVGERVDVCHLGVLMANLNLPRTSDEVLGLPDRDIPDTIRSLTDRRALSVLVKHIHRDLGSRDDSLRRKARAALRKMGFPED